MFVFNLLRRFEVYSSFILCFLVLLRQYGASDKDMPAIVGVDFEVHGRVQGVFFRKYTESKAKELGLAGWCMNTKQGTVLGYMEGDKRKVDEMKNWLQHTGSPQSAIDKAEFRNEKELESISLTNFMIKK